MWWYQIQAKKAKKSEQNRENLMKMQSCVRGRLITKTFLAFLRTSKHQT